MMQRVMVYLDVDRAAAVRAGKQEYGAAKVALDPSQLSEEQRDTLLSLPVTSHGREEIAPGVYDYISAFDLSGHYGSDRLALPAVHDTSIDSIRTLLDAVPTARAAAAAAARE